MDPGVTSAMIYHKSTKVKQNSGAGTTANSAQNIENSNEIIMFEQRIFSPGEDPKPPPQQLEAWKADHEKRIMRGLSMSTVRDPLEEKIFLKDMQNGSLQEEANGRKEQ